MMSVALLFPARAPSMQPCCRGWRSEPAARPVLARIGGPLGEDWRTRTCRTSDWAHVQRRRAAADRRHQHRRVGRVGAGAAAGRRGGGLQRGRTRGVRRGRHGGQGGCPDAGAAARGCDGRLCRRRGGGAAGGVGRRRRGCQAACARWRPGHRDPHGRAPLRLGGAAPRWPRRRRTWPRWAPEATPLDVRVASHTHWMRGAGPAVARALGRGVARAARGLGRRRLRGRGARPRRRRSACWPSRSRPGALGRVHGHRGRTPARARLESGRARRSRACGANGTPGIPVRSCDEFALRRPDDPAVGRDGNAC